jgi:hypothetical protein
MLLPLVRPSFSLSFPDAPIAHTPRSTTIVLQLCTEFFHALFTFLNAYVSYYMEGKVMQYKMAALYPPLPRPIPHQTNVRFCTRFSVGLVR